MNLYEIKIKIPEFKSFDQEIITDLRKAENTNQAKESLEKEINKDSGARILSIQEYIPTTKTIFEKENK